MRLIFSCGSLTRFEENRTRGVLAMLRAGVGSGEGCGAQVTILMDGTLWMYQCWHVFKTHALLTVPCHTVPKNTGPGTNLATSITRIMSFSSDCAFLSDRARRQLMAHVTCSLPSPERSWVLIILSSNKGIAWRKTFQLTGAFSGLRL